MPRRSATVLLVLSATALAACRHQEATSPLLKEDHGGGNDSAHVRPDTTPVLPKSFRVSGQIVTAKPIARTVTNSDSVRLEPIAGAKIRIMHNIIVNGESAQELAAETVSGSNGGYSVSGLPGGYYVVYAAAPVGSGYSDSYAYCAGTSPEVTVNVYLWVKQ